MTLEEVRENIDRLDQELCELLMKRLDCSYQVAEVKAASGDYTIYRADREAAILNRLGEDIPEARRAGYLAVVRKIMETSRMYQYGLIYDWKEGLLEPLLEGRPIPEAGTYVKLKLTRPNCPNSMSAILSMIGDYGYNMEKMERIGQEDDSSVTFELTILGNLAETPMKKLMFQLSMESSGFRILEIA